MRNYIYHRNLDLGLNESVLSMSRKLSWVGGGGGVSMSSFKDNPVLLFDDFRFLEIDIYALNERERGGGGRDTDRQTGRQAYIHTYRQTDRETDRKKEANKQLGTHRRSHTENKMKRIDRQRQRERDTYTQRQAD